MKNNLSLRVEDLKKTNVVYNFKCPMPHGQVAEYIGMTQNCLSRRLTLHLQQGSILEHFRQQHNIKLTRKIIVENTKIIEQSSNRKMLEIKEALLILKNKPTINKQFDNFTNILKLNTNKNQTMTVPRSRLTTAQNESEINFNDDSIIHTSTQLTKDDTWQPELNVRINKLLEGLNCV